MRTIVVGQHGGPEKLMMREVPVPRPLPGQVRLRTILTSVNVADVPSFTANRSAAGQSRLVGKVTPSTWWVIEKLLHAGGDERPLPSAPGSSRTPIEYEPSAPLISGRSRSPRGY